jgi:hypothetical protein
MADMPNTAGTTPFFPSRKDPLRSLPFLLTHILFLIKTYRGEELRMHHYKSHPLTLAMGCEKSNTIPNLRTPLLFILLSARYTTR